MSTSSVRETHVSWLVFLGDRVYKIKKPVVFDFLDLSSVERREQACRIEVDLNRRLSPDVYRGVGHFTSPDGAVEPVVVMERLPERSSLSALIRGGAGSLDTSTREIASLLARFHIRARRGPEVDRDCSAARAETLWTANLDQLASVAAGTIEASCLTDMREAGVRYVRGRTGLIDGRVRSGRAVDGHGDLLCDDIFVTPDGPRILDCLEFDAALRHGDTVYDIASLAMDLEHHGRPDLADVLVREYQDVAGDAWPPSLTHFWVAYRALVRAKVGCYVSLARSGPESASARRDVGRLVSLARSHLRDGRVRVVLVGGVPGTGKSTLARHLCDSTGWKLVSSDVLRRQRAGLGPDVDTAGPYGQGLYAPAAVESNYRAMIGRAEELVSSGESVVLDASWSLRTWRRAVEEMAGRTLSEVVPIECVSPPAMAHRRILERRAGRRGPSDATPAVAEAMAAHRDPWPGAVRVDTSGSEADSLRAARVATG